MRTIIKVICCICSKEFRKIKPGSCSNVRGLPIGVRPTTSRTCSKKCAREFRDDRTRHYRKSKKGGKMKFEINDLGKVIKTFSTQEEAEEFMESHERPWDLDCEFIK